MKALDAAAATLGLVVWASATTGAPAGTVTIAFTIDSAGYVAQAPPTTVSPNDEIIFTFTNDHANDRDVFVCARQEGDKVKSPWKSCGPTGAPLAVLDQTFTLKSRQTAATQCKIKYPYVWTKRYCIFVENGPVGASFTCPGADDSCPKGFRGLELALEVEP